MTTTAQKKSQRDAFGEILLQLGRKNEDIVVLSADLSESTRTHLFEKEFPDRFFQVGVAEQNMAGIAAGLAHMGKIPFITSFAAFSPTGNWAIIRTSIALSNLNVKIVSTHAGFSAGKDGATHQALEDVALMRVLPNMTVLSPCDYEETKKIIAEAIKINGPTYIRLCREETEIITSFNDQLKIGKAQIIKEGTKATVIGYGPVVVNAYKALRNKDIDIIDIHTIKPLDLETIKKSWNKTGLIVTVEEHQMSGGLGDAVSESLSPLGAKIYRLGVKDTFGESGTYQELLRKHKLDELGILDDVNKILKQESKL